MSGNDRVTPGKPAGPRGRRKPAKLDARIRRTQTRLGVALMELIQERPMDGITVRQVLERAGVGRSTFYLHFRDKNDLLLTQLEGFLEMMSTTLTVRGEDSHRVVPVEELFSHIGGQKRIYRALAESGRLTDFFDLAQGYFARGIERRLSESGRRAKGPSTDLAAQATALAGSLLALLRWWLDCGTKKTPREMDQLFHRIVWKGLA